MTYRRFQVDKLIRDYIPEILRQKGIQVHEEMMDDCQYLAALKAKLIEEAQEIKHTSSPEECIEELADVLEVVQALAQASGFSMQQVEKARLKKRNSKGGFDRKIYAQFVDLEERHEALEYYLTKPEQYPETKI